VYRRVVKLEGDYDKLAITIDKRFHRFLYYQQY